MRWFVSYPILAAGLAFGFDTLFPGAPDQSPRAVDPEFASQAEPVVVHASEIPAESLSRLAAFSPGPDRLVAPERPQTSVLDYLARTFSAHDTPLATSAPASTALQPVTVSAWNSPVVREAPTATTGPVPPKVSAPASRVALARDIQRELQRVGCYLGEIDGVWGRGSQRAIHVFMDRVNAALPTREPDVFMLSLLRGQSQPVCGASCPHGQSLAASGRCVPSTLLAQAGKTAGSSTAREASETVVADAGSRRPAPYGRMSIGGPKPDDVDALTTGWSRWETTTQATAGLERTAALEPANSESNLAVTEAVATPRITDAAPAPAPARRYKASRWKTARAAPVRASSYRHVQRLFQHPLGW